MALILIAEDDADQLNLLKEYLGMKSYQVATASDGVGLVEQAKTVKPALIIADIMMPGAYGSTAFKALQEDEHTRSIPVLFLTGITPQQAAKVVPEAPHVRLMHKPIDIHKLVALVDEMLAAAKP